MSDPINNDSQVEALKTQIATLTTKMGEMETALSTATGDKTAAVEELKTTRKQLADAKAKLEDKEHSNGSPADAEAIVAAALAKRDKERADANKVSALDKFIKSHKDISPENDPTGLKLQAFKTKLSRFSTEGLTEVEQFNEVFEDAYRLLGNNTTNKQKSDMTPSAPLSPDEPEEVKIETLTPKEKKVLERLGWTTEKYLALKKKMPDYVHQILKDF